MIWFPLQDEVRCSLRVLDLTGPDFQVAEFELGRQLVRIKFYGLGEGAQGSHDTALIIINLAQTSGSVSAKRPLLQSIFVFDLRLIEILGGEKLISLLEVGVTPALPGATGEEDERANADGGK